MSSDKPVTVDPELQARLEREGEIMRGRQIKAHEKRQHKYRTHDPEKTKRTLTDAERRRNRKRQRANRKAGRR